MLLLAMIVCWYSLGLVGAGWVFSQMQWEFPTLAAKGLRQDAGFACFIATGGLITLFFGLCFSGFAQYGWWKPYVPKSK